ncbi:MAG: Fic family protein [Flavobacteriia bacterium]|nr:Fic family protein [Flavobacteriia bacterium]
MKTLIKNARINKGLKTRELAQLLAIDQALVSKFESGTRKPTREQVKQLAHFLDIPLEEILPLWIKEKILYEIQDEEFASQALTLVQEEIAKYDSTEQFFISNSLQEKLDLIDSLKSKLDKLRAFDSYRIAQALELEYTFESNRIEGNTLTLKETDLVINEGLTVSGKSMREHLEAINHQEAIEYVKDLVQRKVSINERELLVIHNMILRGIMPEYAGKYRNIQVMIKGSAHMPPQPFLVPKKMEEYFEWYQINRNKLHPVVLAAEMHERLVTIHPFVDGNGRTSRLIMNLILLKHGFVIANIKGDYEARMNYYNALELVQTEKEKDTFLNIIADVEIDCLNRYLKILT